MVNKISFHRGKREENNLTAIHLGIVTHHRSRKTIKFYFIHYLLVLNPPIDDVINDSVLFARDYSAIIRE